MQKVISIRPTEELERKLEKLLGIEKAKRSALIRRILDIGIAEELKKNALELFRDKKVSLAKAAEIADVSVREMMDLIKERGIALHITTEDIREDFEAAMER
ncbi:putative antitoxin, contains HTH domain [Candidatus Methanophagaceae archaeon]|jgi:predicted HTH domain antitoxin|nr:putative antitoxin, contains HTH domain [Methanophagales archaeon]